MYELNTIDQFRSSFKLMLFARISLQGAISPLNVLSYDHVEFKLWDAMIEDSVHIWLDCSPTNQVVLQTFTHLSKLEKNIPSPLLHIILSNDTLRIELWIHPFLKLFVTIAGWRYFKHPECKKEKCR